MGWEPSYLVSKLHNLLIVKGKTKGEREKRKRDNKVACLCYFSPK